MTAATLERPVPFLLPPSYVPRRFSYIALFCGAGGDFTGLWEAGGEPLAGFNHWERAIETIDRNHGHLGADLRCVDINQYDMRNLPPGADVLWASVICTELSPAGGRKKLRGQQAMALEEHGHVPSEAYERTRACAWDVIRATEIHRFKVVVVENVVEFAWDWELYDVWIAGMCRLGYRVKVLCVDAAHVAGEGNAPAPQWRGRIYITFTRNDLPELDLEVRPTSYCPSCDGLVEGVQKWKRNDRPQIGKYGPTGQYVYRCSVAGCGAIVEPLVLPAAVAIDWSDLGQLIGDRDKPLAKNTMARLGWGYEHYGRPMVATVAGNTHERGSYRVWPTDGSPLMARTTTGEDALTVPPFVVNTNHPEDRSFPVDGAPLPTRSTKIGDLLATPEPWLTMSRNNGKATGTSTEPMATLAAGGNHHGLTTPPGAFVVKNFGGNAQPQHLSFAADRAPLGTITTVDHHALVVPYRRGKAKTTAEPLHTLSTVQSAALAGIDSPPSDLSAALAVLADKEADHTAALALLMEKLANCRYRMLKPPEHLLGQRFPAGYQAAGNVGEQTMLAGNAVPVNVAHHIGCAIAEVLA